MTVSRIKRNRQRFIVLAVAVSLLAGRGVAAQDAVQGNAGASAGPRTLTPVIGGSAIPPPVETAPLGGAPASPAPRGSGLAPVPAPVSVETLGTIEGPVAGTLNDANGGLGYDMWAGSDRVAVETILQRAPAATPSVTSRFLLRNVLLTEAPLPTGNAGRPFNAMRIRKLLEAGAISDAGQLAGLVRSRDAETQRMQADAMLYAGRDIELCGDATNERLQSAEPYWVALRAYCYFFDGDELALELTRTVTHQQSIADTAFWHLLDNFERDAPTMPDGIAMPNAIHIRMLVRQNLPIPENAVNTLSMPASMIAAMSEATPHELRRSASERAFLAGALPAGTMAEILDAAVFDESQLGTAATLARGEPLMDGLERIRAALRLEQRTENRAELIYAALQIGQRNGVLPQMADLFADYAETIVPALDWGNWSSLMAKAMLLAERPEAAARWQNILDPLAPGEANTRDALLVAMAIAAPNEQRVAAVQDTLTALGLDTLGAEVTPAMLARAALVLGLVEAVGLEMPPEALSQVAPLVSIEYPGRRPAPLAMGRIEDAALEGRRGEVALGIVEVLGPRGASEVAPDIIVRCVRALQTAGLTEAAVLLAKEAILTGVDA